MRQKLIADFSEPVNQVKVYWTLLIIIKQNRRSQCYIFSDWMCSHTFPEVHLSIFFWFLFSSVVYTQYGKNWNMSMKVA